jgi:hypothetical protein
MEFKLYYYTKSGAKVYLDGTESEGYSLQTAITFARDNASSMPITRIYLENALTCQDDRSYISVNGVITVNLY